MPRKPRQRYRCPPVAELVRQLGFTPPAKRREQVRRAEKLHDQIEPEVEYPPDFVTFRITGYRSEAGGRGPLLKGADVLPDLRLLIDALSRSVDLPADGDDPAETADELAARLGVSTKTVQRWRERGLRWRWASDGRGERRLVIPRGASDRFAEEHAPRVARAGRFSRMPAEQRRELLDRARRLAEARGVSLNQVATHLAARTGRAVETLRLLLEKHDREHPERPIFADRTGPLTPEQRRVAARAHRMGVPMRKITRHFKRAPSTIYRAIRECRAGELLRRRIIFVVAPTFTREDADQVILRPDPPAEPSAAASHEPHAGAGDPLDAAIESLPESIRPAFGLPGLPADRAVSLLVRMNYLKFKAAQRREALDRADPRTGDMDQIEAWLEQAEAIRQRLLGAHLRAALSVARRQRMAQTGPGASLPELLDLARRVLLEAIDSFDASRGQTLEAYFTWLLMRRYASLPAERRAHRRGDEAAATERLRQLLGPQLAIGDRG